MARFATTLGEALNAQSAQARSTSTVVMSAPAMEPVGPDGIQPGAVDTDKLSDAFHADLTQRIDDAAASIVTASRIAPGAVTGESIADFTLTVQKLRDDRHHLY